MNWLDILDYPDDFHVWKPTGAGWVNTIDELGCALGNYSQQPPMDRRYVSNKLVTDHLLIPLKIGRVNYITKVIYLELA